MTKLAAAIVPLTFATACSASSPHASPVRQVNYQVAGPTLVPLGEAINTAGHGSMTLTKAACGQKQVRYTTVEGTRRAVAKVLRAAAGHQFCTLIATFTDTDSTPLAPAPFANLFTASGQSYPEDTSLSTMASLYSNEHPSTSQFTHAVPPGQSIEFRAYFEIPMSAKASSIAWPATSLAPPQSFVLG